MVVPALDLRGGKCVRLRQGRAEAETIFSDDPLAMAAHWAAFGPPRLHMVDLDAAFGQTSPNRPIIAELARTLSLPLQVGGGLRDLAAIESLLGVGVQWVILGTRAAQEPGFVKDVVGRFPGRVLVGIDAIGGRVAVEGWTRTLDLEAVVFARDLAESGVAGLIYTDVQRDGTGEGPNLEATRRVAVSSSLPVFASGGIGSLEDLRRVAALGRDGVVGAIVGRALYTGAVDLKEALALSASPTAGRKTSAVSNDEPDKARGRRAPECT